MKPEEAAAFRRPWTPGPEGSAGASPLVVPALLPERQGVLRRGGTDPGPHVLPALQGAGEARTGADVPVNGWR